MADYELVIFDVDGTLLDTSEGIMSSVLFTIERFGFEKPTDEQMRSFIGPPIQNSFAKTYGITNPFLQEVANVFRGRYSDCDLLKAVPYEGIFSVFEQLKNRGVKCAVATYKRQDYARTIMRHFGFDKYTDSVFGADNENKLTKKDIIEKCIRVSGMTDKNAVLMIGDTDNDAIGAEQLGVKFLAVTYGFGFRNESDCAAFPHVGVANSAEEIIRFI